MSTGGHCEKNGHNHPKDGHTGTAPAAAWHHEKKESHSSREGLLTPARASLRAHLGELVDAYMQAKIKIIQKLTDMIAGENDLEKLMNLRSKLNEVLLTDADITLLDAKIRALLAMLQTNATTFIAIREEWMSSLGKKHCNNPHHHDDHPHFPHGDNHSHN